MKAQLVASQTPQGHPWKERNGACQRVYSSSDDSQRLTYLMDKTCGLYEPTGWWIHGGFLESAGPQNSCDLLNALSDNQLPADSQSAWKLHASACMHTSILVRQLIVTRCIQVVTKNTVHHKACALSRKPLWVDPPSQASGSGCLTHNRQPQTNFPEKSSPRPRSCSLSCPDSSRQSGLVRLSPLLPLPGNSEFESVRNNRHKIPTPHFRASFHQ